MCLAPRPETLIAPRCSTLEFVVAPPVLISSPLFHTPTDRNPLRAPETMIPFESHQRRYLRPRNQLQAGSW